MFDVPEVVLTSRNLDGIVQFRNRAIVEYLGSEAVWHGGGPRERDG